MSLPPAGGRGRHRHSRAGERERESSFSLSADGVYVRRSRVETLSRDGPTDPKRSGRHADDGPGGLRRAGATGSDPERDGGDEADPHAEEALLLAGCYAASAGTVAMDPRPGMSGRQGAGPSGPDASPASCVRRKDTAARRGRVAAGDCCGRRSCADTWLDQPWRWTDARAGGRTVHVSVAACGRTRPRR